MSTKNTIVCWWSGGVTSAVACYLCIGLFGLENCQFIFIDTHNEDDDTYRFKNDCEKWYGKEIKTISAIPEKYKSIKDVWYKFKSLNVANGAICSTELKRLVRENWQKTNTYKHQIFGFDIKEYLRVISLKTNHPNTKPIFPLLLYGYSKKDCVKILTLNLIRVPDAYHYGYLNNNCLQTGCVQGGIGYWQKYAVDFPDRFNEMAFIEHELTEMAGQPVTILRDQSKGGGLVFLKHNPKYPNIKYLSMMKGIKPEPLVECNGLCGTNDLKKLKA